MKLTALLLCCVFVLSCSTTKNSRGKVTSDQKISEGMPEWITNPGELCPATKLCAVGEATGMMQAEAKAREELAKIFSTRVSSTTTVVTESSSETKSDVVSGSVSQESGNLIKEVTDQVLEGVEVEKTWNGPESVFALAVLSKKKVSDKLASEMDLLDKEMGSLYKRGRRADIAKAIKMHKTRALLDSRYQFLKSSRYPSPISLTQLFAKRRELGVQDVKVELDYKSFDEKKEIKDVITTQLIGSDYKVVKAGGQFKVKATVSTEKEYLNVEGFERHRFQLAVASYNGKSEKVGALDFSVSAIGRDFAQSYSEALSAIKDYIENHLDELNMD